MSCSHEAFMEATASCYRLLIFITIGFLNIQRRLWTLGKTYIWLPLLINILIRLGSFESLLEAQWPFMTSTFKIAFTYCSFVTYATSLVQYKFGRNYGTLCIKATVPNKNQCFKLTIVSWFGFILSALVAFWVIERLFTKETMPSFLH